MANPAITVNFRADDADLKGILRAFSRMDKAANQDLRNLSKGIASDVAENLRSAARGTRWYPAQAQRVAESIRVSRDRTPYVALGGSKQFTNEQAERVAYGSLVFGSEFGSALVNQRRRFRNKRQTAANTQGGLQLPPRSPREGRGNRGWWVFPRLKRLQPDILRTWLEGARKVADEWAK